MGRLCPRRQVRPSETFPSHPRHRGRHTRFAPGGRTEQQCSRAHRLCDGFRQGQRHRAAAFRSGSDRLGGGARVHRPEQRSARPGLHCAGTQGRSAFPRLRQQRIPRHRPQPGYASFRDRHILLRPHPQPGQLRLQSACFRVQDGRLEYARLYGPAAEAFRQDFPS